MSLSVRPAHGSRGAEESEQPRGARGVLTVRRHGRTLPGHTEPRPKSRPAAKGPRATHSSFPVFVCTVVAFTSVINAVST